MLHSSGTRFSPQPAHQEHPAPLTAFPGAAAPSGAPELWARQCVPGAALAVPCGPGQPQPSAAPAAVPGARGAAAGPCPAPTAAGT